MMSPSQRRKMRNGLVHVVTDNKHDIWAKEAMSLCGRLLFSSDPIADDSAPTCKRCESRLKLTKPAD